MIRARLNYLILAFCSFCGFAIYKWLPDLVSYEIAVKCIYFATPISSALLLLFWRQYRSQNIYEKLNGLQARRFNSLKPLIYNRILFCFFMSVGASALALIINFIVSEHFQIDPKNLQTIYLATTAFSLSINLYISTAILLWMFELADFIDTINENEAKNKQTLAAMERLDKKDSLA